MHDLRTFTWNSKFQVNRWAATWQNQQNECALSEDSDQPGHPPSLIRVFAVRMKQLGSLATHKAHSEDSDQQADLSLRWAHSHFSGFVMRRLRLPSRSFFSIKQGAITTDASTKLESLFCLLMDVTNVSVVQMVQLAVRKNTALKVCLAIYLFIYLFIYLSVVQSVVQVLCLVNSSK